MNEVVPRLATEQVKQSLEEGLSIEVQQKSQRLVIRHEVHDVQHVQSKLSVVQVTAWELLTFKKDAHYPEQLVANIEGRLFDLILAIFVGAVEECNVLSRYSAQSFVVFCGTHELVLLSNCFLSLHVVQQHCQDLGASFSELLCTIPAKLECLLACL